MKIFFSIYTLLCLISVSGCTDHKQQYLKRIKGAWAVNMTYENMKIMKSFGNSTEIYPARQASELGLIRGFEFHGDTCYYRPGFFDYSNIEKGLPMYLGSKTTYTIIADTLKIWNIADSSWARLFIKELKEDTLILMDIDTGNGWQYLKVDKRHKETVGYDAVAVLSISSSEKYLDEFQYINRKGDYIYQPLNTPTLSDSVSYYHKFSISEVESLFSNFGHVNFNNLKETYLSTKSGGKTTYYIFFIENGHIVKTISDDDMVSPDELQWGYLPLMYLKQLYGLESISSEKKYKVCDVCERIESFGSEMKR